MAHNYRLFMSCTMLLLSTEPSSMPKLLGRVRQQMLRSPEPCDWSYRMIMIFDYNLVLLVYSERSQDVEKRIVPYFKLAKACLKSWPVTLCPEAQGKLKSHEEFTNTAVTMCS